MHTAQTPKGLIAGRPREQKEGGDEEREGRRNTFV